LRPVRSSTAGPTASWRLPRPAGPPRPRRGPRPGPSRRGRLGRACRGVRAQHKGGGAQQADAAERHRLDLVSNMTWTKGCPGAPDYHGRLGRQMRLARSASAGVGAGRRPGGIIDAGLSRSRPCPHPSPALSGRHAPTMADRRGAASLWSGPCEGSGLADHGELAGGIRWRGRGRDRRWARTMASVGIRKRVSGRTGQVTYQVSWLLDDGSQGAQTVATPAGARALQADRQGPGECSRHLPRWGGENFLYHVQGRPCGRHA